VDLADELRKLEDLHRRGALTDEEFARAKASVLGGAAPAPGGPALDEQLTDLRRENELARLDREWAMERERYLVTGRYGARYLPSVATSVVTGVIAVGFGLLWTAMAASLMNGFGPFPLFGLFFVALGLWVSVSSFQKALRYRRAYEAHQRRRADLLAGGAEVPRQGD
jgi:hypothetical protein